MVLSIDLRSAELRTFDNLLVRVPNETMVKSQVTNLAHFPVRRLDLTIEVPYSPDLSRVRERLMSSRTTTRARSTSPSRS